MSPRRITLRPTSEPRLVQPHSCTVWSRPSQHPQPISLAFSQFVERVGTRQPFLGATIADLPLVQQPSHRFVTDRTNMVEAICNRLAQTSQGPSRSLLFCWGGLPCQVLRHLSYFIGVDARPGLPPERGWGVIAATPPLLNALMVQRTVSTWRPNTSAIWVHLKPISDRRKMRDRR